MDCLVNPLLPRPDRSNAARRSRTQNQHGFTPTGGTPVDIFAPAVGSDDNDFFVARAKLNFKFGTY
ncbi:hypothetical protein BB934_33375 (plasmid) [Microvirga ossetica]|uniref:Uncharacterized protein n=1 Tax=Microvirga ossetica TaxID=1882682 RepID=A0A1B2ESZ9_9HYPH|nr:hypothetical protein BB934_33375 [Microvirga ossetica]